MHFHFFTIVKEWLATGNKSSLAAYIVESLLDFLVALFSQFLLLSVFDHLLIVHFLTLAHQIELFD